MADAAPRGRGGFGRDRGGRGRRGPRRGGRRDAEKEEWGEFSIAEARGTTAKQRVCPSARFGKGTDCIPAYSSRHIGRSTCEGWKDQVDRGDLLILFAYQGIPGGRSPPAQA